MKAGTAGILGSILLAPTVLGSAQDLVADINQEPTAFKPGSDPAGLVAAGGRVFFAASDALHGKELWTVDDSGAPPVLVREIAVGLASSMPDEFVELPGGDVLFAATADDTGRELWRSDGTAGGTRLVRDIRPGKGSSMPYRLVGYGGDVYFLADDGAHGHELWRSDGTGAGTTLVAEVSAGSQGLAPAWLLPAIGVHAGGLVFAAYPASVNQWQLWASDGTEAGTLPIAALDNGTFEVIEEYGSLGDRLVFSARNASSGLEPWVTDGTPLGTHLLADVEPNGDSTPHGFVSALGEVYFSALSGSAGIELWKTDGTRTGTALVVDLAAGSPFFGSSTPFPIAELGDELLFTAWTLQTGRELWATDGTAAGTRMVVDLQPGAGSSQTEFGAPEAVAVGGELFLVAGDSSVGSELWRTDGTAAGTVLVEDIAPGPIGSWARELTALGGTVFLSADDFAHGFELWSAEVAGGGATLVADLFEPDESLGSNPTWITRFQDEVFFVADDGVHGAELWRTDGTPAGTRLFLDLYTGSESSAPSSLKEFGDSLFFFARTEEHGAEPWITDGTAEGTMLLADVVEGPGDSIWGAVNSIVIGNELFFSALADLWVTDGTPAGTKLVGGPDDSISTTSAFAQLGDQPVFFGYEPETGFELRKIGADGEIQLVADVNPGSLSGISSLADLISLGNGVLFPASGGVLGFELWFSDGTAAGTRMLVDLVPGSGSSSPQDFVRLGDGVLFLARGADGSLQPFATDGTAAGTVQLAAVPGSAVLGATASDGFAAFQVNLDGGGRDLWRTDGTPAGTVPVVSLSDSGAGVAVVEMTRAGSGPTVLFPHDDGVHGEEVWRTDGTAEGTALAFDLAPLGLYAYPKDFLRFQGQVLFAADGGTMGTELFSVSLPSLGEFVAEPFGISSTGAPVLATNGDPIAGQSFELEVRASSANLLGLITVGTGAAFDPVAGDLVSLVGQPFLALLPFSTGAAGLMEMPIPLGSGMVGDCFALQAFVLEPQGLAASQGLEIVVGP